MKTMKHREVRKLAECAQFVSGMAETECRSLCC